MPEELNNENEIAVKTEIEPFIMVQKEVFNYFEHLEKKDKELKEIYKEKYPDYEKDKKERNTKMRFALGYVRNPKFNKELKDDDERNKPYWVEGNLSHIISVYVLLIFIENNKKKKHQDFETTKENLCKLSGLGLSSVENALLTLSYIGVINIHNRKKLKYDEETNTTTYENIPNLYLIKKVENINFLYGYEYKQWKDYFDKDIVYEEKEFPNMPDCDNGQLTVGCMTSEGRLSNNRESLAKQAHINIHNKDTIKINNKYICNGDESPCMKNEVQNNLGKLKNYKADKINSKPIEALKPRELYAKAVAENFGGDSELLELWNKYMELMKRSICNPAGKYNEMLQFLKNVADRNENSLIKSILLMIHEDYRLGKINVNYRDAYSKIFELYRSKVIYARDKENNKNNKNNNRFTSGGDSTEEKSNSWVRSHHELFTEGKQAFIDYHIKYLGYNDVNVLDFLGRIIDNMSEEDKKEYRIDEWEL